MPLRSFRLSDGRTVLADDEDGTAEIVGETARAETPAEEFGDTIAASRVILRGRPLSSDPRAVADTEAVFLHLRAEKLLEAAGKRPGLVTYDEYLEALCAADPRGA